MSEDLPQTLTEHIARGNELMSEVREEIRLSREEMRLSREARQQSDQRYDELVTFSHQLMLRNENAFIGMVAAQEKVVASQEKVAEAMDALRAEVVGELRAFRAGFLALIDELRGSGPAAA